MEKFMESPKRCLVTRLGFPFAAVSLMQCLPSTTHGLVITAMCKQPLLGPYCKYYTEVLGGIKYV